MTDNEVLEKVIEFVNNKDEEGFYVFISTLSKEQFEKFQETMRSVDNFLNGK